MKKLIFLIMLAVTMAAQGTSPVSSTRRIMQQTDGATYFTDYSNLGSVKVINRDGTNKCQKTPAENEVKVSTKITLNLESEKTKYAFFIPTFMEAEPFVYIVKMNQNGKGSFILPKDTYDILIYGNSQGDIETVLLTYINLTIDKDTIIEGSFDDAQISVDIVPKGPDGTIIHANSNDTEGNIIYASQILGTQWKNISIPFFIEEGSIGLSESALRIRINQISEIFKFTRIDQYVWTGGITDMIMPIDFSKAEISPTLSNWQTIDTNFCQTPLNINQKEVLNTNALELQFDLFANNGDIYGGITRLDSSEYTTLHFKNKIDIWCPEEYTSEYEMWAYPSGSFFVFHPFSSAGIIGMPLRRGEKGLVQIGFNPSEFKAYTCTGNGYEFSGNPRYSGEIQYDILGNCSPILTTMPDIPIYIDVPKYDTFSFTYTGRYGENMQIDASVYPEGLFDWSEELRKELGLPVCDVAVDLNGERVCESIDNWWNFMAIQDSGVFDAEISTDNILIDETISGLSTAKIHYDSNIGNGTAPTLTYLQFRNSEDKVTDRLASPNDGFLEFYALAPVEKRWEKDGSWGTYFDTGELESVKAEWSPMGQDNWKEIELAEIPELFYLPGFGYCFRGYLNGVDKESDNKWYDLRVRIEDTYGAYQEQTISPAFRIESITDTGIQSVSASANTISVYGIDGKAIMTDATESDLNNLASGLYIVRTGNNTRKIAIP